MAFPLTYTASFELNEYATDQFQLNCQYITNHIRKLLADNLYPKTTPTNQLTYVFKSEFLGFEFETTFDCQNNHQQLSVKYTADLVNLFKILVAILMVSALMASFSIDAYFIFAVVFSVVFYVVNIFFIDNQLRKLIFQIPGLSLDKTERLSAEQLAWIRNKELCSACGTKISVYDLHCPECGLRLKQSQYLGQPLDVSKYQNAEIKYHYKHKNSDTN